MSRYEMCQGVVDMPQVQCNEMGSRETNSLVIHALIILILFIMVLSINSLITSCHLAYWTRASHGCTLSKRNVIMERKTHICFNHIRHLLRDNRTFRIRHRPKRCCRMALKSILKDALCPLSDGST